MEIKLLELLFTQPAIFILFGLIIWFLTNLIKQPIKRFTALIEDEQKRKIANKWILLLPLVFGLAFAILYAKYKTGLWFDDIETIVSNAFLIAVIAITWYNVFERNKGKKSEYEDTLEGIATFNLLLSYMKDKSKVTLLLDQCRDNYASGKFSIFDTVKGFLPIDTDPELFDAIVKTITKFFRGKEVI